jgi:hypothetical protein
MNKKNIFCLILCAALSFNLVVLGFAEEMPMVPSEPIANTSTPSANRPEKIQKKYEIKKHIKGKHPHHKKGIKGKKKYKKGKKEFKRLKKHKSEQEKTVPEQVKVSD